MVVAGRLCITPTQRKLAWPLGGQPWRVARAVIATHQLPSAGVLSLLVVSAIKAPRRSNMAPRTPGCGLSVRRHMPMPHVTHVWCRTGCF
jgi:hypothetical protein